jgi:cycloeucalenol cycloisomerase
MIQSIFQDLIAVLVNREMDIVLQMTTILGTSLAGLVVLIGLQSTAEGAESSFLPDPRREPSKYAYEIFAALYTPIWILLFGLIVVTQYYESLTPSGYIVVCLTLALPFLLQPLVMPGGILPWLYAAAPESPDAQRPLLERYSFKANVWIAVYSLIGNYWYTHYFYSVLEASYTMPNAIRFNHVPVQMYLATHFYFSTYHFFSNCLLRKICTAYAPSWRRTVLFVAVVGVFSYFTAFMETLTISSYPYYTFANRHLAYTVGSAFYGIYFLVSFPAFYYFDAHVDDAVVSSAQKPPGNAPVERPVSLGETIVQSCGYGMIILFLLDFVRLWLNIPLIVGGGGGGEQVS